jgi:hypothetical protein
MNERVKILIDYDGSDCAEAAFDDLRLAGLPDKAQVVSPHSSRGLDFG